jgi:hypothetical protein
LEEADVTFWKFHREVLFTYELTLSRAEHTINTRVYLEYFSKDDTAASTLSISTNRTASPLEGEASGYSVNNTHTVTLTARQTNIRLRFLIAFKYATGLFVSVKCNYV